MVYDDFLGFALVCHTCGTLSVDENKIKGCAGSNVTESTTCAKGEACVAYFQQHLQENEPGLLHLLFHNVWYQYYSYFNKLHIF